MHLVGSQGAVGRVAQGDLHRFVRLVYGILDRRQSDGLADVSGDKSQGSRSQGIVGSRTGGGPAGDGVVHGDVPAGFRRKGYDQGGGGGGLGPAGSRLAERNRGGVVVVLDGVSVGHRGPESDIVRIAQGDLHRLVRFIQFVVLDRDGDGLGGIA